MSRRNNAPKAKAMRPGAGVTKDPGMNPDQLKMLMTGRELKNTITYSDDADEDGPEGLRSMWDDKLDESKASPNSGTHGKGVYESLLSRGYEGRALTVYHVDKDTFVLDGHHRIAAAADLERHGKPIYIPVEHELSDIGSHYWDKPISFSMFK